MDLKSQFYKVLNLVNYTENQISELWESLYKAYSAKSRYYHNISHIESMMEFFVEYQNKIENPLEMQLAIFYHDLIYNVNRKDNEEKSAELAVKLFKNTSLNLEVLENLILSTKSHDAKTEDEKWLVDFDLSILGKPWEEYELYFQKIRKEYRIYPDLLYKPGRKKVLNHFLEKERIFLTDELYSKYEESARKNLEKEIGLF